MGGWVGGGGGGESGLPLCKHDSCKFNPVSTDTIWHSRVIERELRPYRMTSLVVVEVVANNANNNAANTSFYHREKEREREKNNRLIVIIVIRPTNNGTVIPQLINNNNVKLCTYIIHRETQHEA